MIAAFDTETHLFTDARPVPKLVCSSWAWPESDTQEIWDARQSVRELWDWLAAGESIVGANVAFDMAVVCAADSRVIPTIFAAYREGRIHDVLIRQALHDIAEGHLYKNVDRTPLRDPETGKTSNRYSLSICAQITLGQGIAKADTWRLRYAELDGVPISQWPAEAVEYAKNDAKTTMAVYVAQQSYRNLQDEARQCRAAWALHLACVRGLRTDPERVAAIKERVTELHEANQKRFREVGILREDNTADRAKLLERVTAAYGGNPPKTPPTKKFPEGQVSVSRITMLDSGDDLLTEYAEMGENQKLFTTYLKLVEKGTQHAIVPKANVLVETGRTSYTAPNLQNIPRKGGIRECFKARDGYLYCSVDYSTLELCTLAQTCINKFGKSSMADALNAGRDLHTQFAAQIANTPYEELLGRVKAGDRVAKGLRQLAKVGNFGLPGGLGALKLVQSARKTGDRLCLLSGTATKCDQQVVTEYRQQDIPPTCAACLKTAERLKAQWFKAWPEMATYFEQVRKATQRGRCEIVQEVTKRVRGNCTFCQSANTPFQGLAADGAKHAMWMLTDEIFTNPKSALKGTRLCLFIHDEAFAEVPEARAHEAAHRIAEVMIAAMREFTPDIPIKAEPALSRYWYKDAAPVYRDGRLVAWEPPPKLELVAGVA